MRILIIFIVLFGLSGKAEGKRKDLYIDVRFEEPVTKPSLNGLCQIRIVAYDYLNNGTVLSDAMVAINGVVMGRTDSVGAFESEFVPGRFNIRVSKPNYEILSYDSLVLLPNTSVTGHFTLNSNLRVVYKPVIYLYPENLTHVQIKLNFHGNLGFTYPEYADGWSVEAFPDGTILCEGKQYNYLFWDGYPEPGVAEFSSIGAVVSRASYLTFLESTLSDLGLSDREKQDFITFWAPKLLKHESCLIRFLVESHYDEIASVEVDPEPDSFIRVFMTFAPVPPDFSAEKQTLPVVTRNTSGFTYVEWGGMELPAPF